ncbi:hypothetical protein ASPZODRAFT_29189 [Penicilliopsis zonata CBS 506.65]|uniref:Cyanovirin-N domain-containing protein n=1 Tax=Penicilliopsis zonata CBS 506.65 TaxID=1073090 RepID=A0A1L9S5P4_9EURO|nr:hypothetical protein ASPZODRAFT_29189 [Penicilliopsis zonata CBS 506.65]OJJ42459.1 hypothetical protein ASPZODRAFT_29189 [Penicilliopsis zonata CBS 506.65]
MQFNLGFLALLLSVSFVAANDFKSTCKDYKYKSHIFHAKCEDEAGTYIATTLLLDDCIGNDDGYLKWEKDGDFTASCNSGELILIDDTVWFSANCAKPDGSYSVVTEIDLNAGITNDDGTLKCDD